MQENEVEAVRAQEQAKHEQQLQELTAQVEELQAQREEEVRKLEAEVQQLQSQRQQDIEKLQAGVEQLQSQHGQELQDQQTKVSLEIVRTFFRPALPCVCIRTVSFDMLTIGVHHVIIQGKWCRP